MGRRTVNTKQGVEVWLVEQNPLVARYLKYLLHASHKVKVYIGERPFPAKSGTHVEPSVLIIDEATLPASLNRYLWVLRARFPKDALLLIGRPLNDQDLCRLIIMGVKGYIPYDEVEKDLSCAINSFREGHMWFPAGVLEQFALFVGEKTRPKQANHSVFTEREKVVLGLLHRRLSNKEISSALGITGSTVKFHLEKIFDKLGVRDRHSVAEMIKHTEFIETKEKPALRPALAGLSTKIS